MTPATLYALAYVTGAAVSLSVGIAALRRRPAPGSAGLAVLSFAQAEWSAAYALQWALTDHGPSLAWLAARNIGLFITPVAILVLVASYVGKTAWRSRGRIVALSVVPLLSWVALVTDPWHGLYLAGVEPTMKFSSGGVLFAVNLVYSYSLTLYAVGLLVAHLLKRPPYPKQAAALLVAVLLPVVHFAAQMAGLDLVPGVNSVPFTFTVSGAFMWFALTRLGLFQLVPIARDQLIEQLPVGIVVFDADRRIIDANPEAARLTGATVRVLGKTADEAFPQQIDTVLRLREGLLSSDTVVARAEFMPGTWVEATASVVKDRAGQRIATLVTLRDITESLNAERMQRDFVANLAHELQTPLTGLSLLARTIPNALRDDPQAVEGFIRQLGAEVDRIAHLTDELMTLSFAETLSASAATGPADLSEIVAEQVDAIIGATEAKNQSVTVAVPAGLKTACSAFDLGIMLGNLLRNAMHYTGPDGRITVEAGLEHDGDGTQWVALRVIDNGIGIPPDDQERIFERFYRVDKARSRLTGGAGLGLAIVKQFAEKNGGSVTLSSTPGQGSTFTVRLPAA